METRWKDTYDRLITAPISGPGIKEEVLYLRAEAEALQGLTYLLLPSRYGLKIAGDVFKILWTWMSVNDFVCQVCAGASAEPRTGHSNTEGDPEGAGDGGGGEGDQARCKES